MYLTDPKVRYFCPGVLGESREGCQIQVGPALCVCRFWLTLMLPAEMDQCRQHLVWGELLHIPLHIPLPVPANSSLLHPKLGCQVLIND